MTLNEATNLVMQHRQLSSNISRWRWQKRVILAGMRDEIKVTYDIKGNPNYSKASLVAWLNGMKRKPHTIWFTQDVSDKLHKLANGKFGEISRIVNEAVKDKINK